MEPRIHAGEPLIVDRMIETRDVQLAEGVDFEV
jgi:siroheme synthase